MYAVSIVTNTHLRRSPSSNVIFRGNKAPKWNYADSNGKEIELNSEANSVLEGAYSAGTTHYHSLSFPIGGKSPTLVVFF